ncbi:MAG: hypothetical protein ABFD89_03230 [Bryobacteraceae bacterium]
MPLPKSEPAGKPGKAPAGKPERKPWKKKTPVEIVLDQEEKLKHEIAEIEVNLKAKRDQLSKFEQARKIFEAT